MWISTLRQARRVAAAVIGFTLIAAGVVMLVTPGPGWLAIFLGLSVLGAEFVWARRLLNRLKEQGTELGNKVRGRADSAERRKSPPQ
ncbi:MAG TPA: PGPGW domain-containing protein [Candidatus Binataceae bacterium]|jgi:tellurite resistance protein TerC|nr:PGPGW domain-containing protein [Candidatus Binataceae bacterium]